MNLRNLSMVCAIGAVLFCLVTLIPKLEAYRTPFHR